MFKILIDIGAYIIFAYLTWALLMQIYKYSTYHKYFKYSLIILISFSVFDAFIFHIMDLYKLFLWHIPIFLILFFINYRKQKRTGSAFIHLIDENEKKGLTKDFYQLSLERTQKYYLLSSFIYLITFSLVSIYLFNRMIE